MSCVGEAGFEPATSSVSGKRDYRCATRPLSCQWSRNLRPGTVYHVGYIVCLGIGVFIGAYFGLKFGGVRALYRLGQTELGERRRRAKV
jgi:hypothetical protein